MMIQVLPHYPTTGGSGGGGTIEYVGGTVSTFGGTNANKTISLTGLTGGLDTAPTDGDLILVSLATSSSGNDNLQLITSGYTEQTELYRDDARDANLAVYTKIASSDTDVVVGPLPTTPFQSACFVRIQVWRGVDQTTPMDVAVVTGGGTNSGDAVIPAITPVTTGAVVVGTAVSAAGNPIDVSPMSNTGSYSPFSTSKLSQGVSCLGGLAWAGGAVGPFTVGGASGGDTSWAACALALRPA